MVIRWSYLFMPNVWLFAENVLYLCKVFFK